VMPLAAVHESGNGTSRQFAATTIGSQMEDSDMPGAFANGPMRRD